ncbi:MAG: FIST C-terminal domain-containing protein [Phycisphaeraceae bacterium]|nr:FIST C-terminal domain-containing protein [Phycisphaeraceae bacterium]
MAGSGHGGELGTGDARRGASRGLRMAHGLSGNVDTLRAAEQVCEQVAAGLDRASPDLVTVFFTSQHAEMAGALGRLIRRRLGPKCLIGCSGETVLGGEVELEGAAGISMLAAAMPGVGLHAFRTDQMPAMLPGVAPDLDAMRAATGMRADYRATLLLVDPFSVAMNTLLPLLSAARPRVTGDRRGPIIGGMASGAMRPGGNVLLLDDGVFQSGYVGVSLNGAIRVDPLVSQGCRPFGPTMIVTGAKGQMIHSLGGRKALEVLHEAIMSMDEPLREQLRRGVFIGRVVNEYKERFGRGDFLIRNVVGADQEAGVLAVAEVMRAGQTVRFHMRDAATASEDLGLLLDAQQLYGEPAGTLLFTCNGRGMRLFDEPNHDAAAICRAFLPEVSGEERARAGRKIEPAGAAGTTAARSASPPLAGFFAGGEIGPVGDEVFLHGHTACAAIFREESPNR